MTAYIAVLISCLVLGFAAGYTARSVVQMLRDDHYDRVYRARHPE